MTNGVNPDQTAPSGAVWSVSTLFEYAILPDTLVYEISDIYHILSRCYPLSFIKFAEF